MPYPDTERPSLLENPLLADVREGSSILRRGSTHAEAIRCIQRALTWLGLPVQADGDFGPTTESKVKSFQHHARLGVDGRVGSYTLHALHEALAAGQIVEGDPPIEEIVEGLYSSDRFGNRVALTFDDGPGRDTTGTILDILAERSLKGTFFVLGRNVRSVPDLVIRAAEEGHTIGNHSWDHPDLGKLAASQVRDQLDRTHRAIVEALGQETTWGLARPPYGSPWFDTWSTRKQRVGAIYRDLGYRCIMWNIDSRDWVHRGRPDRIIDETLGWLKFGRGGVALLHDIHRQTVDALPGLIDRIQGAGFEIVPLESLIRQKYGEDARERIA